LKLYFEKSFQSEVWLLLQQPLGGAEERNEITFYTFSGLFSKTQTDLDAT